MGNILQGELKAYRPGQVLTAADFNRLLQSDWQNQAVLPAPFSYGFRGPGGSVAIPIPTSGGGSSGKSLFPAWWPYLTKDGSGNDQANFYPGTIGGILPTGLTAIALTQSQVNYVYLAVTATAGVITAATITVSTTYPTLAAATSATPPTTFNIPIAIFDLTASPKAAYNIVGFGNIWAQPYVTLFTTINTGSILQAPFTPSYNWEWGAGD